MTLQPVSLIVQLRHHPAVILTQCSIEHTDDFATSFLNCVPLLDCPRKFVKGGGQSIHSPSCFLPPFNVPCKMVLALCDEQGMWSRHCSLHLFMFGERSICLVELGKDFLSGSLGHYILCLVSCGSASFPGSIFFSAVR